MKTIFIPNPKDLFSKYWKHVAIVILLLFVFFQCNSNHSLEVTNADLKSQVETNKQLADIYIQKNDYLAEVEEKHNDTIEALKKEISITKSKIIEVQKNTKTAIAKVKKFNRTENTEYIAQRYDAQNSVKQNEFGTNIADTITNKIIVELAEKDSLKEELIYTNDVLFDTERLSFQKDEIIKIGKQKEVNLLIGISELNKAIETQEKIIKNTEKQVKREKAKKTFWKLTTLAVLGASGYLLITK